MARPLTASISPPPPEYTPSHNDAIDSFRFGRWPHLFTNLAREYKVPGDMVLVLLFLWEATVGCKQGPDRGLLALSQVPVRDRNRNKWLAAFEASGFFTVEKAGPHDRDGSRWTYDEETSPQEWEAFFQMAEWLNTFSNWDAVKQSKKFGEKWFKPAMLERIQSGDLFFAFTGSKPCKTEPPTKEEFERTVRALFAEARDCKEEK